VPLNLQSGEIILRGHLENTERREVNNKANDCSQIEKKGKRRGVGGGVGKTARVEA